jgi:isoquinoline 1-oxidoreductase beta subunit
MSKTPSRAGKIARRGFLVGALALGGGVAFGVYAVRRDPANPLAADLPEGAATLTPYVLIDADGVTLITPRADLGQGAYHVQAMLLAEELDVRLDQVRLDPGPPSPAYWNGALATEAAEFFVPRDGRLQDMAEGGVRSALKLMGLQITGGSTTVPDAWVKLRAAGASARETLKLAAAKRTGAALSDLRSEDGAVILPDGTPVCPIPTLLPISPGSTLCRTWPCATPRNGVTSENPCNAPISLINPPVRRSSGLMPKCRAWFTRRFNSIPPWAPRWKALTTASRARCAVCAWWCP